MSGRAILLPSQPYVNICISCTIRCKFLVDVPSICEILHFRCGTESRFLHSFHYRNLGTVGIMFKNYFARQAAAVLLKFAKTTSDPHVAAALVDKAADMKDRVEKQPPPLTDVIASPPNAQPER
jgi:hypothetical protein